LSRKKIKKDRRMKKNERKKRKAMYQEVEGQ
jgi:hypothetical protein